MQRIVKSLMTIGAVAAAAFGLSTLAPEALYAQQHHPYTATCLIDGDYPPGKSSLSCTLSPAPPPNVQAVIQSVDISLDSFELSVGPGVPLYASLTGYSATTNPPAVTYVPFTSTPTNPNTLIPAITTVWVAHELTEIYVDPNRPVLCSAVELNLHPDAKLYCTVSGYFIED